MSSTTNSSYIIASKNGKFNNAQKSQILGYIHTTTMM